MDVADGARRFGAESETALYLIDRILARFRCRSYDWLLRNMDTAAASLPMDDLIRHTGVARGLAKALPRALGMVHGSDALRPGGRRVADEHVRHLIILSESLFHGLLQRADEYRREEGDSRMAA